MKYLLLGGAGFIGTHLTNNLMDDGHEVVIIDNLATAKEPKRYTDFVNGNVAELDLDQYVRDCDIVYFLAASVGVDHIDKNPTTTLKNNIGLMQHVIPYLEKYNRRTIFSSSSEVYGDGVQHRSICFESIFSESKPLTIGPPTELRWGYASAKLTTEFMIAAGSFPHIIARFFNVVGPGQLPDYGMVLPRFIEAAKNNQDIIVHGDGSQIRSFCHVKDAVDFLRQLEYNEGIFNVGNEQPITIAGLAELVVKLSGSQSKIKYKPYNEVFSKNTKDILFRVPDLTKLRSTIDFNPKYSLSDIIEDML